MKNNVEKTFTDELFNQGFGIDYCRSVAKVTCEIDPLKKIPDEIWKQKVLIERLELIILAIQKTVKKERIILQLQK